MGWMTPWRYDDIESWKIISPIELRGLYEKIGMEG